MTKPWTVREIGLSGCDETIARKAAHLLEDAAASGTLALGSDIAAAVRERRLEDALNLQRAAFRARMLGGINRARTGFDRDQRALLDMAAERRAHRRWVTMLTIGKLVVERTEHACMVRDISEAGAGIACDRPLTSGQPVRLAMRGLPATPARVRWSDGKFAGLQFDAVQDAQAILSVALRRDADVPRGPRAPLAVPVAMAACGRQFAMTAADISPGGMKLRGVCDIVPGTPAEMWLDGARDGLTGTVCWAQDGLTGIRFARTLTREDLDAILTRGEDVR